MQSEEDVRIVHVDQHDNESIGGIVHRKEYVQKAKDLVHKKNSYKKSSSNLLASLSNLLQSDNYAAEICEGIKASMKKFVMWKEEKSILYKNGCMYIPQNEAL
ncbi:hypothetical protein CIHG_10534 [Coccidioides immitis H538.4]|uniref:Uncharacterized protein n=1 Tax=Coccidioides immitis H538.4 TaxID=396776 RepID=A0A0J8S8M2_COCIT|nr:hypothetical protein CIHG_10534 [Coccidioides immitis H538.4]